MSEPKTQTLGVPGAALHYDIREAANGSGEPKLLMIGLPMGAEGFTTLAGHFPDRAIVTYATPLPPADVESGGAPAPRERGI